MNNPRMLYKYPGKVQLQDGGYQTTIVDEVDVDAELKVGWRKTPAEAKALTLSLVEEESGAELRRGGQDKANSTGPKEADTAGPGTVPKDAVPRRRKKETSRGVSGD